MEEKAICGSLPLLSLFISDSGRPLYPSLLVSVSPVFLASSIFVPLPHPLWLPDVPRSYSGIEDRFRVWCGCTAWTLTVSGSSADWDSENVQDERWRQERHHKLSPDLSHFIAQSRLGYYPFYLSCFIFLIILLPQLSPVLSSFVFMETF